MKVVTKQLILFALIFAGYTLAFRALLSNALETEAYGTVWIYSVLYGGFTFITAWYLGKSEGNKSFLFDAGLRFHVVTFLVWGIVSEFWFLLGYGASSEPISIVHFTLFFWGIGLLIHAGIYLYLRKDKEFCFIQCGTLQRATKPAPRGTCCIGNLRSLV